MQQKALDKTSSGATATSPAAIGSASDRAPAGRTTAHAFAAAADDTFRWDAPGIGPDAPRLAPTGRNRTEDHPDSAPIAVTTTTGNRTPLSAADPDATARSGQQAHTGEQPTDGHGHRRDGATPGGTSRTRAHHRQSPGSVVRGTAGEPTPGAPPRRTPGAEPDRRDHHRDETHDDAAANAQMMHGPGAGCSSHSGRRTDQLMINRHQPGYDCKHEERTFEAYRQGPGRRAG